MSSTFDNKVYELISDGSLYSAGTGIDINIDKVINVKIDNDSIKTNDLGQLYTPNALQIYSQKQIYSQNNDYIKLITVNYISTFAVMNIAVQLEANHSVTINFNDDLKTFLHNCKPFYVQCLSNTHSITTVDNNNYSFTNGGAINFSDDNSITVSIGSGDYTYNFNFIAYYNR